jgi:hypothetical protein
VAAVTGTEDDEISEAVVAHAQQIRRQAASMPGPDEIRDLADAAARRREQAGMTSSDVRQLGETALARARQLAELLQELSEALAGSRS